MLLIASIFNAVSEFFKFWLLFFLVNPRASLTFFGLALPPVGDVWPVDWGDVRPKKKKGTKGRKRTGGKEEREKAR